MFSIRANHDGLFLKTGQGPGLLIGRWTLEKKFKNTKIEHTYIQDSKHITSAKCKIISMYLKKPSRKQSSKLLNVSK
jgi:hypothetical protein